jgi:steroid 5-alpha reductase family enzyme
MLASAAQASEPGFSGSAFGHSLELSVAAVVLLLIATFVCALIAKRHNVIDAAWGLGFVLVALASFLASRSDSGALTGSEGIRRWLLLLLPAIWGGRLALYIRVRGIGKGEDPRYAALLDKNAPPGGRSGGARMWRAIRIIYLLQGALILFIGLPLIVGASTAGPMNLIGWIGAGIWLIGLVFEAVGDAQMSAFKGNPSNRGTIMDRGLWRLTRHPNYFGDACVWTGLFLLAAQHWPGVLTALSPIAMILLLTKGSGAANLERHMAQRPGYQEYMARTSGFIPLPPKQAKHQS